MDQHTFASQLTCAAVLLSAVRRHQTGGENIHVQRGLPEQAEKAVTLTDFQSGDSSFSNLLCSWLLFVLVASVNAVDGLMQVPPGPGLQSTRCGDAGKVSGSR